MERNRRLVAGWLGLVLACPLSVLTQEPSPPQPPPPPSEETEPAENFGEEILVTARRREESAQKVPVSVTVFSETALEERSMDDLSDLGDFTPNMNFSVSAGFADQTSDASVVIRGVGQIETSVFADPAVGIYVDGVFLARAQGAVLDLLDLERVEVLRGPQGTLFGKNTTGGAISVVTRKPSRELAARIAATLGDFDRRDLHATVGGPLHDDLSASLALVTTNRDGFSRSLETGQRYDDDHRDAARLALHFSPAPRFTADFTADATRERESGANQAILSFFLTPFIDFYNRAKTSTGGIPFDERWVTDDLLESHADLPPNFDGDIFGTMLRLDFTNPSWGLRSITAWRSLDFETTSDTDGAPIPASHRVRDVAQDQFSQEVQLSGRSRSDRLEWVLGGLYFRERPRENEDILILGDLFDALEAVPGPLISGPGEDPALCNPGPPPPGVLCFGGAGNPFNLFFFNGFFGQTELDLETTSVAAFAEGTYAWTPELSLTLGLRYSHDEKSFAYRAIDRVGAVTSDLFNEDTWDAWTPRISLAYQARPEVMLYASVARGYKSGGFNGRPQQRQVLDPYDPETVLSYELGVKGDWWKNRLRLNTSLFYSDFEDIQFAAQLDVDGVPVFVTQNAGSAEIRGFEAELVAEPRRGLLLTAGVGHTDAELVELDPGVPAGLREGGKLPKTPEWTANGSLQQTFALGGAGGAIVARADYSYRSKVFNNIENSESIAQDGYGLVSARIHYAPPSDRWDVAIFGTNLTDEAYIVHGFFPASFGVSLGLPGRPRELGMTVRFRF